MFFATAEYTLLEDLKPLGFKTVDRLQGLDLKHALLALKELGKFHGTSLAMRQSQPKTFDELTSNIQEIVFTPEKESPIASSVLNSTGMAIVGLKVFKATENENFDAALVKIKNIKKSAYTRLLHSVQQKGSLSVICHGDFHLNNILFKYDTSGEVSDVRLIDFQIVRYASLSLDLLYFLVSSLQPGVMSSHFEQLMETYCSSLNEQIENVAPTASRVSLNEIFDELRTHSVFGLLMGFLVLPAITALPEFIPDIGEEKEFSAQDHFQKGLDMLSPEYFRRIKQVVKDYEALGYL